MEWLNKVDDALDRVFLRPGAAASADGGDDVSNSRREENPSPGVVDGTEDFGRVRQVARARGGSASDRCSNTGGGRTAPRPPPPPPPPAAAPVPTGSAVAATPSTPIAAAATAGEFLIDESFKSNSEQTDEDDESDGDGQTSQEKLQNLAKVMQQLERDARREDYHYHGRYDSNAIESSDRNQSTSQTGASERMANIPLLPLSSIQITPDANSHETQHNQLHQSQRSQHQQSQQQTQQLHQLGKPSTKSKFIVHLPTSSTSSKPRPPPPPPPPLPQQTAHHRPPHHQQQWEPSTPHHLPLHTHTALTQPSPLPTPRMTPRTNALRPTPGIIRRKIRSPSVSPTDSPLPSFDDADDGNVDAVPPPPLYIDEGFSRAVAPADSGVLRPQQGFLGVQSTPAAERRAAQQTQSPSISGAVTPSGSKETQQSKQDFLSGAAITAARKAQVMQSSPEMMTPIPPVKAATAKVMVHRSPRLDLPFCDDSTAESEVVEETAGAVSHEQVNATLGSWFGSKEQKENKEAPDKDTSKNEDTAADDDSSSTSFHSHISNQSELTDDNKSDNDSTEQNIKDFALSQEPIQPSSFVPWNPSFNCYGIVHVRVLRAQRLPCAAGTFIVASLALPPWKGRIRIASRVAIDGPEEAGVCLRWDRPMSKKEKSAVTTLRASVEGRGSVDGAVDPCSHSMVHAYNNEDTPIPIVSLTLSVSSMGGVFEKFLCAASFSCRDIMKNPGIWTSKWYSATLDPVLGSASASSPSQTQSPQSFKEPKESVLSGNYDCENPLILLEACFEPKVEQQEEIISEDSDTLGPIPRDLVIRSKRNDAEIRLRSSMPEALYSSIEEDSLSKTSSLTSALARHHSSKAHLLRVRTFWTPAWCSVCNKLITSGWMTGSFECEACHIFCCKDCQLQVDVSIPCGSELSKIAVKKAQQYQVSIGQVMTTLAPYVKETSGEQNTDVNGIARSASNGITKIEGIGLLSIRVLNACLFDKTYPPDTEPSDVFKIDSGNLRHGDHYVRISWLGSKDSKRTKTVLQAAKPVFDSDEMTFDVKHYGMEYKLEVVDSNTDKAVGSYLLSPQTLLQWQRDDLLSHWDQLFLSILHLRRESEPRRMKLELRTTVKDGFGLNFYNSTKLTDDSKEKSSSAVAGEISGWLEVDVHFEEDTKGLFYSSAPRQCPPRATEEFDIAMIQLHIARISAIVEDIQKLVSAYLYLVSWDNSFLTGVSLVIFVVLTLTFNLEYLGALPIGMLVIYMLYLGHIRLSGHFKDRWVKKERNALIESESKIEEHHTIHRPVGLLLVGDLRGRNLRSRELGLPGSFYVSISYDPLRYANEKKKKALSKLDSASACTHQVGATVSPGITSSPIWTEMRQSAELRRLKHLLPDDQLWDEEPLSNTQSLVKYPILQPITKDRSLYVDENKDSQSSTSLGLLPWKLSLGAVVLQVRFSEVLGSFQLFENVLGEVVLPLAKLAGGQEVEGWFRLLGAGTTDTVPGQSSDDDVIVEAMPHSLADSEHVNEGQDYEVPELYLKVKFLTHTGGARKSAMDTETSKVICEELVRTASMSKEGSIGMIGSSISTLNTVRTLGGTLQSQISYVVNMIEMARNAFNFSSPRITCILLVCLIILWVVLTLIPTRFVVLLGGLGQYAATYYAKFISVPNATTVERPDEDEEDNAPSGNIVENLFLSIPTDEDLRRTYFWEAQRVGEREREKFADTKRQTRLEKLWKASWHGNVKVKEKRSDSSSLQIERTWSWDTAFVLIEGHRFIWWRSEKHFDTGEAPLGQIFFAGHSGLAGLSPLDLRELSKEEIPFVVSVFGRGAKGQQKITLLASSSAVKDQLENAVLSASSDKKAD